MDDGSYDRNSRRGVSSSLSGGSDWHSAAATMAASQNGGSADSCKLASSEICWS